MIVETGGCALDLLNFFGCQNVILRYRLVATPSGARNRILRCCKQYQFARYCLPQITQMIFNNKIVITNSED